MKSRARLAAAITAAVIGLVIGTNVSAGAAVKAAPRVTTSAATSVTATSATLNGIVNPGGLATSYWFQWGTTTTGWSQGQNFTLRPLPCGQGILRPARRCGPLVTLVKADKSV